MSRPSQPLCRWQGIGLLVALSAAACAAAAPSLEGGFHDPPASAKPQVWYHVMNGNATKAGVTRDFEAIAAAGLGGVTLFDAGCFVPPGPLAFNSPEWFDFVKHAASEARRLGLSLCLPNCSGWSSSGGPWVKPADAMKKLVWFDARTGAPPKDDHGFYADIAEVDGLRFGMVCNGRRNHPASRNGEGLEVDKLSAAALDAHFDAYIGRICDYLGDLSGNAESGFNAVLVDSYEVGPQDWTQGFEREFERRRGYSPIPFLPVFAGRTVKGEAETARFLRDYRRVIADLFAENYSGRLAARCHERGLKLWLEPYGNFPADNLQYGEPADVPMAEFWSVASAGDHCTNTGNARFAAYLAHVWGRRFAAAEAFTANPRWGGRWLTTPFAIKAQCDRAYTEGINRMVFHRFVHQPWTDVPRLPGMTMGRWGMHFDRTQTWWPHVGEFVRYQSRCQWMLQEGTFAADALFFCGDAAPNQGGSTNGGVKSPYALPRGYAWDVCATRAFLSLKVVRDRVVAPGGTSYALLVLPEEPLSAELRGKVDALIASGAHVCRIGEQGDALAWLGVAPDFADDAGATYIHRRGGFADWYFVALDNAKARRVVASFRIAGLQPEIWNAETGTISDAGEWRSKSGRTEVALDLPPNGSAFVVFRRKTSGEGPGIENAKRDDGCAALPVRGIWHLAFPVDWYTGGRSVKSVVLTNLVDWTSFEDPDLKYFSGTATYRTRVSIPRAREAASGLELDLGEVRNFAVVTVNGKRFPALWRPPYRVDITTACAQDARSIELEVEVTNLWPNRLIGDEFLPDDCAWSEYVRDGITQYAIKEIPQWVSRGAPSPAGRRTFTTWKHWGRDDAPLPSGLLGPVEINITRTPCAGKAGGLHSGAQMDEAFLRLDVADGKDRYTEP